MKKFLLCLLLGVTISIYTNAQTHIVNELEYFITSSNTCRLIGFGESIRESTRELNVPSEVLIQGNQYAVTEIWGFDNSNITSVKIPASVVKIDASFNYCTNLKSVYIEDGDSTLILTTHSFYGSPITNIYIGRNWQFEANPSWLQLFGNAVASVTLGEKITELPPFAFYNLEQLSHLKLPSALSKIGNCAFKDCTSLTSIELPESVKLINAEAFAGCTSLTSIKIPEAVDTIMNGTFLGCTNLQSVNIPHSVKFIAWQAFENCTSLTYIQLPDPIPLIAERLFKGCKNLRNIKLPDKITAIFHNAFDGCICLDSLKIPETVTEIQYAAFRGCTSLKSINISGSLRGIPDYTFEDCASLSKIELPENINSIEYKAFKGCKNLKSLNIPLSVYSIEDSAFADCDKLSLVRCLSLTPPDISKNTFAGVYNHATLEIAYDAFLQYAITDWEQFKTITFGDAIAEKTQVGDYLYRLIPELGAEPGKAILEADDYTMENASIPQYITNLGLRYEVFHISYDAFRGCQNIKSITLPASITSIRPYAFADCPSLNSVILSPNITEIAEGLFQNSAITEINIPNGVTRIKDYAFYNTKLEKAEIPSSVTNLGFYTFANCAELKTFKIADGTISINIGEYTLNGSPVQSIYIGRDYDLWRNLISGETLKSIEIGNNVTTITSNTFYGNSALESLHLGSRVKAIESYAFEQCPSLTEFIASPSLATIGYRAFSGNTLKRIVLGHNINHIYDYAFEGNTEVKDIISSALTPPKISDNSFSSYNSTLHVKQSAKANYLNDNVWSRFNDFATIGEIIEPTALKVNATSIEGAPGESVRISAKLEPADVTIPDVFFLSTNPEVATVDRTGLVTFHDPTTSTQQSTLTDGDDTVTCDIKVMSLYADGPIATIHVNIPGITGIDNILDDNPFDSNGVNGVRPQHIYNLQGILIKADATDADISSLTPGIYIIAGKKTLIR